MNLEEHYKISHTPSKEIELSELGRNLNVSMLHVLIC